jgi:hypothetical protein
MTQRYLSFSKRISRIFYSLLREYKVSHFFIQREIIIFFFFIGFYFSLRYFSYFELMNLWFMKSFLLKKIYFNFGTCFELSQNPVQTTNDQLSQIHNQCHSSQWIQCHLRSTPSTPHSHHNEFVPPYYSWIVRYWLQ